MARERASRINRTSTAPSTATTASIRRRTISLEVVLGRMGLGMDHWDALDDGERQKVS